MCFCVPDLVPGLLYASEQSEEGWREEGEWEGG